MIFKWLSIVKNCLRPQSASLNLEPEMSYLDNIGLELENTIVIFEISAFEVA